MRWMCRWQARLIVSAALHCRRDYGWQLRLLIKAPTLKKTEELHSRRTSVSSHQAPTCPLPDHHHQRYRSSFYSYPPTAPPPHQGVGAVERGKWHHKSLPAVSRLIMSTAACLVSGFPRASCDRSSPRLRTSRLSAKEEREGGRAKINRMFFHLVNWQHRLLEPCLSKPSVWNAFRLAEGRIGKWKHGKLLSLDDVS